MKLRSGLPATMFCWIALMFVGSCSDSSSDPGPSIPEPCSQYCHYNALFDGSPPLSDSNPIAVASPKAGDSYRIGDTIEVVVKLMEATKEWWGIMLSTNGDFTRELLVGFSGANPNFDPSSCVVNTRQLDDIIVVKAIVPGQLSESSTVSSRCLIVVVSYSDSDARGWSGEFEIRSKREDMGL